MAKLLKPIDSINYTETIVKSDLKTVSGDDLDFLLVPKSGTTYSHLWMGPLFNLPVNSKMETDFVTPYSDGGWSGTALEYLVTEVGDNIIVADISKNSFEKVCKYFEIGISYDSNIDKAMKIIQKEAEKHPEFLDIRTEEEKKEKKPAVPVRVVGFGDSSVNLKAWIWTQNPGAAFRLGCDLNKSIKEKFDKAKIEIPFPYRTIVYKKKRR